MMQLKKYLTINSLFSGTSGLIMLIWSNWLNDLFSINNYYIFPVIGFNLLLFSAFTGYVLIRHLHNFKLVRFISLLDALWVAGSFIIVSFRFFDLSQLGYIIMSLVAVWIAFLAYNQFKYSQ